MTHAAHPGDPFRRQVDEGVEDVKEKISPWVGPAARVGFLTKGMVYIAVGALAIRWMMGLGGQAPSKSTVFTMIAAQPFGRALLSLVAAGLVAYALWRIVEAVFNPEHEPKNAKGWGKRLAWLGSGLAYGAVGIGAAKTAAGLRSGNPEAIRDWTQWGMAQPFGRVLVAVVGLCVVGKGIHQVWKAWKKDLTEDLQMYRMDREPRKWAVRVGRLGLAARGVVFLVIGTFLVMAGVHSDPHEARGLSGALQALERGPYGVWVLGVVAVGLIAYGVFALVEARYRRIRAPQ